MEIPSRDIKFKFPSVSQNGIIRWKQRRNTCNLQAGHFGQKFQAWTSNSNSCQSVKMEVYVGNREQHNTCKDMKKSGMPQGQDNRDILCMTKIIINQIRHIKHAHVVAQNSCDTQIQRLVLLPLLSLYVYQMNWSLPSQSSFLSYQKEGTPGHNWGFCYWLGQRSSNKAQVG